MDLSNLRRGEQIAGISGIVLIVSMFLTWWSFGIDVPEGAEDLLSGLDIDTSANFNAWQASNFNDIVWFLTGAAAVALALVSATRTKLNSPVALSAVVAVLGVASLVLIVIRLLDPPGELDRSYGVFIGLIAIAGVLYGAWLTMQDDGTSIGGEVDELRERFAAPAAGAGSSAPEPAAPEAPAAPEPYVPEDPEPPYEAPEPPSSPGGPPSPAENLGDTFPTTPPPPPRDPSV